MAREEFFACDEALCWNMEKASVVDADPAKMESWIHVVERKPAVVPQEVIDASVAQRMPIPTSGFHPQQFVFCCWRHAEIFCRHKAEEQEQKADARTG